MTKRARVEESPPPRSKARRGGRKQVAFPAPKASAKAIIERNAITSPLLRLPRELRDRIWTEVLGGRLVHLEYKYFEEDMDSDDSEEDMVYDNFDKSYESFFDRSLWRNVVCEDDGPENRGKQKAPKSRYYITLPGAKERQTYPHDDCDLDYQDPGSSKPVVYHDHEGMRLTVLRASRQLYAEANPILWTTNTFSFHDGVTFQRFMMTRTINQKRLVRSLRFEMDWGVDLLREWNKALNMMLVKSLIGLRTLRLNIMHHMMQRLWFREEDSFLAGISWVDGLWRLSTLPLTSAEVAFRVRDYDDLWQKADRDESTKRLQKILVNPKGAEVYAELQRQLKISR
ncbi:MAG: hypothetical protein Q9168_004494 [Polycauliona sp. 1 TL-2023]